MPANSPPSMSQRDHVNDSEAVARLYHAWITGLVLSLVARQGAAAAESFVFSVFRRQHKALFLPGLQKLGLEQLPDAVACARYHYHSNQLGGVKVEYLEENEHKAWVRYPPPRWIWSGTAICGIPPGVNLAMLRGWHAHNGVTLKNPRLGFVCTGTTVDGHPGLEGYYQEYDHNLAPEERLRLAPEEECPRINPLDLPALDTHQWPQIRQAKAYRNYAMAYLQTGLPVLVELLGTTQALAIGRLSALQIGMHFHDELAQLMNVTGQGIEPFTQMMQRLLLASGDTLSGADQPGNGASARDNASDGNAVARDTITRTRWRLFPHTHDVVSIDDAVISECCTALFEGLLATHNRHLKLSCEHTDTADIFRVSER